MRIADNSLRFNYIISAPTSRRVSVNEQATAQAANDVTWMMSSSAHDEKATAKARLQAAKDLLAILERWGFPPRAIARTAAALEKSIASAAADFGASSTVGGQPAECLAGSIQTVVSETASENKELASAGEVEGNDSRWNSLPGAYKDVVSSDDTSSGSSSDDQATLDEFKSVANRIKALLERAMKEMRAKDRQDTSSQAADPVHPSSTAPQGACT